MSDEDGGSDTALDAAGPVGAAIAHEQRLLDPAVRADSSQVDLLLAPDFSENGQDGRHWSREATIEALAQNPRWSSLATNPEAITLNGRVVAPGVVLVFYDKTGSSGGQVRRHTLWRETRHGWRAVFHQATPIAE